MNTIYKRSSRSLVLLFIFLNLSCRCLPFVDGLEHKPYYVSDTEIFGFPFLETDSISIVGATYTLTHFCDKNPVPTLTIDLGITNQSSDTLQIFPEKFSGKFVLNNDSTDMTIYCYDKSFKFAPFVSDTFFTFYARLPDSFNLESYKPKQLRNHQIIIDLNSVKIGQNKYPLSPVTFVPAKK